MFIFDRDRQENLKWLIHYKDEINFIILTQFSML
jgi:hypothetical protein